MKTYEITFITKEEPKEAVKKDLESFGGRILSISSMGQKTFVYPIEKEKSGFYTTYLFEMETEKVQDFNRKLGLEEDILRHLIIAVQPSQILAEMSAKAETQEAAVEPQEIVDEPTKEIVEEPAQEIVAEPEKEIEAVEDAKQVEEELEPVVEEKEEKIEEKVEEKKETKKEAKPKKVVKEVKPEIETNDEEERLEALDKKLEELLKE